MERKSHTTSSKNRAPHKAHSEPGKSDITADHEVIRRWVESRGGRPAIVKRTDTGDSALLRIDFNEPDEELEPISWERFFDIFEKNKLAFLYQEKTADGGESRFFKFVRREDE